MAPHRTDVVLDCNIFLQAISRINGPAAKALRLVEQNAITLHLSRPILRELRRALAYPDLRQANPHVTDDAVEEFLTHISFRGVLCRDVPRVFSLSRDPGDDPYIDLAAAVHADYLVTRDKDLLSLATDSTTEAKQFRQRWPSLKVVNPVSLLDDLAKQQSS